MKTGSSFISVSISSTWRLQNKRGRKVSLMFWVSCLLYGEKKRVFSLFCIFFPSLYTTKEDVVNFGYGEGSQCFMFKKVAYMENEHCCIQIMWNFRICRKFPTCFFHTAGKARVQSSPGLLPLVTWSQEFWLDDRKHWQRSCEFFLSINNKGNKEGCNMLSCSWDGHLVSTPCHYPTVRISMVQLT